MGALRFHCTPIHAGVPRVLPLHAGIPRVVIYHSGSNFTSFLFLFLTRHVARELQDSLARSGRRGFRVKDVLNTLHGQQLHAHPRAAIVCFVRGRALKLADACVHNLFDCTSQKLREKLICQKLTSVTMIHCL